MKRETKRRIGEMIKLLLWVLGVIWFCVFIYRHSGIDVKKPVAVNEVSKYEYMVVTSPENSRIKEVVPREVIYRYVEYK